jgi:peptide deformylase
MLKLVIFPNTILTERMPEFDFENPIMDPKELEKQMIEFMFTNHGLGLAANQVGIRTRVFTMGHSDDPESAQAFFNPIVEKHTDDTYDLEEGCLSFPGIYAKIKRPKKIQVTYQTSSGETRTEILEDYNAKCFLHELDHLEGITYKDRTSALKWAMAIKKSKPKRKFK